MSPKNRNFRIPQCVFPFVYEIKVGKPINVAQLLDSFFNHFFVTALNVPSNRRNNRRLDTESGSNSPRSNGIRFSFSGPSDGSLDRFNSTPDLTAGNVSNRTVHSRLTPVM